MLGFLWNLPTPLSTSYLGSFLLPLSVKPSISCYLTQRTLLPLTFSFLFYFIFSSLPFATHLFLCDFPNSLTTPYYPTRYAPRYLIQNSPLVLTYKRKTFTRTGSGPTYATSLCQLLERTDRIFRQRFALPARRCRQRPTTSSFAISRTKRSSLCKGLLSCRS